MREILFRGKSVNDGEWAHGSLVITTIEPADDAPIKHYHIEDMTIGVFPNEHQSGITETVAPSTIGQFTGLTDKNGKKIFEGDIVKVTDSPFGYSYIGVTCFHEGSFCIQYTYWNKKRFHRIGQTDKWQDMGARGTVTYKYEVVGNIHDNPELMGGGGSDG